MKKTWKSPKLESIQINKTMTDFAALSLALVRNVPNLNKKNLY